MFGLAAALRAGARKGVRFGSTLLVTLILTLVVTVRLGGFDSTGKSSWMFPWWFADVALMLILGGFILSFMGGMALAMTFEGTKRFGLMLLAVMPSLAVVAGIQMVEIRRANDANSGEPSGLRSTPPPSLEDARKHLGSKAVSDINFILDGQTFSPAKSGPHAVDPAALDFLEKLGFRIGTQPGLSAGQVKRLAKANRLSWSNPAIPADFIVASYRTLNPYHFAELMRNRSFPAAELSQALQYVRGRRDAQASAMSPSTGVTYQYDMSGWNQAVIEAEEAIRRREDAPADEQDKLIMKKPPDPRDLALQAAARNSRTEPARLTELATMHDDTTSEDEWIREAVAGNPNTPENILDELFSDKSSIVRKMAESEKLRRQKAHTPGQ